GGKSPNVVFSDVDLDAAIADRPAQFSSITVSAAARDRASTWKKRFSTKLWTGLRKRRRRSTWAPASRIQPIWARSSRKSNSIAFAVISKLDSRKARRRL